jgi:hypothetical protein
MLEFPNSMGPLRQVHEERAAGSLHRGKAISSAGWGSELSMPQFSVVSSETTVTDETSYSIPLAQQQAFTNLVRALGQLKQARPLIMLNDVAGNTLSDVVEAARPLAVKSCISAEENRDNALNFIRAISKHRNERSREAVVLRSVMSGCYGPLEDALDSKVLQLHPNGGVDVEAGVVSLFQSIPLCAGIAVAGAFTSGVTVAGIPALTWAALAALAVNGATCLFRRELASVIRGGLSELKITRAIMKLRAFMHSEQQESGK